MTARPSIVYLPAPIVLNGITVQHTQAGLKFLIEHYETVLAVHTPKQMSDEVRNHIQSRIANYKIHLELYERNQQPETSNQQP